MTHKGFVVERKPGVFYRDTSWWVPLDHPAADYVRRRTTLLIPAKNGPGFDYLDMWKQARHHIVIPKYFPLWAVLKEYGGVPDKVVNITGKFEHVDFTSAIKLDYHGTTHQRPAYEAWMKKGSGILNLACGKGKTVVALHAIASAKVPALVVVHTGSLLTQWREQAKKFLPGVKVGSIRGNPNRWSWRGKGIVIATLQTLVLHNDKITPELRGRFGTIIWDEVHHLGAEKFSETADMFIGNRYGLTATVNRGDATDNVYYYHLGKVFYSDLSQQLIPKIYFIPTPVRVDLHDPEVTRNMTDKTGSWNIPRVRGYVASMIDRLEWEAALYRRLRRAGRVTLVLSHSVKHLDILSEMVEHSGLCTGSVTDLDIRTQALLGHDIVFATTQLAREGLDRQEFDTLVISTPFGSGVAGANNFQQAIGRILRPVPGKRPVVIILDDINIPPLHNMVRGLIHMVRRWPSSQGGPLDFDYLKSVSDLPFL